MSDVIKVNQEVIENELGKVFAASENIQAAVAGFRQSAEEVSEFCGNALSGVIERLTDKSPGSLTTLVEHLREQSEELKKKYSAFAESLKVVDEANIDMGI